MLSGCTFLLLTNPDKLAKLTEEVRSAFQSEDEISIQSASQLPYLMACLEESLRRYPPVPIGLPRVVPRGGKTFLGQYVPEGVSCGNLLSNLLLWFWPVIDKKIRPMLLCGSMRPITPLATGPIRMNITLSASSATRNTRRIGRRHCSPSRLARGTASAASMFRALPPPSTFPSQESSA